MRTQKDIVQSSDYHPQTLISRVHFTLLELVPSANSVISVALSVGNQMHWLFL